MNTFTKTVIYLALGFAGTLIGAMVITSFCITVIFDVLQILSHEWLKFSYKLFKSLKYEFDYIREPKTTRTTTPSISRDDKTSSLQYSSRN